MKIKTNLGRTVLILIFLASIILAYYIGSIDLVKTTKSYIEENNIEGNIIDFFGNLIISGSSALIAYIVSNSNIKKQRNEYINNEKIKTNSKLKLLAAEIDSNIKTLNQSVATSDDAKLIKLVNDGLSNEIWSMIYLDISVDQSIIEKIYISYLQISLTKTLEAEELKQENYRVVKSLSTKLEDLKTDILKFIETNAI